MKLSSFAVTLLLTISSVIYLMFFQEVHTFHPGVYECGLSMIFALV